MLGQISQTNKASEGLAEYGPLLLGRISDSRCETLADSLEVADVVVLAEKLEVLEAVVILLGYGIGGDWRAETDAAVVEEEDLVASIQEQTGQSRVLRL